ncbi:MAG: NAD(P)-dependent oxidoreductase [Bacteroidota bacterium]
MRIVVTGSSGFLGGAVARAFAEDGHEVVGLDVRPGPPGAPWRTVLADLTEAGSWSREVSGADVVIHAAARVGDRGTLAQFRRQNVTATREVVRASAEAGRLVHVSSIVVHGSRFPSPCPEDHPPQPTGAPYTDTKIIAEHAVLRAHASGEVRAVVVRPGDVYGPGSEPWTARPVRMMQAGQFVLVRGGVLSPVFVDDLVRGLVLAATVPEAEGDVFHLAGGVGVPAAEYFGHYATMLGVRLRSIPQPIARGLAAAMEGAFGLARREPPFSRTTLEYVTHPGTYAITRAAEVLDWCPEVDLPEGMRQSELWLRSEGLLP